MPAAIAGLGGALKGLVFQIATLNDATYLASTEVVIVAVVGGIGTLLGPVAGAAAIVGLDWLFAESEFPVMVINGIVFMACVLMFRKGIVGTAKSYLEGRAAARRQEPAAASSTSQTRNA